MVGIVSYGAYVPYYRLKKETVAQAFGKKAGKGSKAVAYCDEDSLTMAVAAALDAVNGTNTDDIRALYFASTTSPYAEKQAATQVAAALDLGTKIRTADFANTLRAGSSAVLAGCDALAVAEAGKVMVTFSDCRLGAADGKFEDELGDAAAAFLLGTEDLLATIDASASVAKEAIDEWRADDDRFVRFFDVRYASTLLYTPLVTEAVSDLFAKTGLAAADYSKLVLYGHDDKTRSALAAKLGFAPEQVVPSYFKEIGNSGNAAAGLMLCKALDDAKAGDRILFVSYGEGADAISLTVTEKAASHKVPNSVEALLAHKNDTLPYGKYLKWKGMITTEPQRRPPQERSALPDLYRNYKKNHALYGSRCNECGTIVFPPQRICVHCGCTDNYELYSLRDKVGTVRTFTADGLSISMDSPNIIVDIECEGGGKMLTYLVDCKQEDVYVGMKVKPTFRKLFEVNGASTYFWKVIPVQEV